MNIFTKSRKQTIIVDERTNFEIQRFARHHANGNPVDVLWNGDEWSRVSYRTKETKRAVVERLKKIFDGQYDVGVSGNLIFVLSR